MAGLKNGNPRHTLTVEEQRRGGQKSAETRARRKTIREAFEAICSERYTDEHGNEIDGITAMCMQQFQLAMNGDTKAFVEIRNSLGEMPTQRVEVDTIDPEARERVERILSED
jgi:hypothetical protein